MRVAQTHATLLARQHRRKPLPQHNQTRHSLLLLRLGWLVGTKRFAFFFFFFFRKPLARSLARTARLGVWMAVGTSDRNTPKARARMFRNQYDGDITTWSPKGRIHQVEYACEAVKQGSACVALKSKSCAVVAALKRASSTLGEPQQKVFKIDSHMGIGVSGLCADARSLVKLMRTDCLDHRYVYGEPRHVSRLVEKIANKSQVHTQKYGRRPYGVGLLVIGHDESGAHVFETSPDGNYYAYRAQAIGARAQSAKTYLEKHVEEFGAASRDELITHALLALRDTVGAKDEEGLTPRNTTIAFVGADDTFTVWEGEQLRDLLENLEGGTGGKAAEDADAEDQDLDQ